jgi:hypothetical protein
MPLAPGPKGGLLSDLASLEESIARSSVADPAFAARLDQGEKRYRHLIENSLGLICTHDLDGIVLSVNPAAADSLGYDTRDGIGRSLKEFLSPSMRSLFDDYLRRIKENGRDSGVMRVVRRDGTERIWLYRNVLYAVPGTRPYVLGHAIDVTERVSAEAALRKNQAQTLEATARLAGHVAHAFNNLITVILGSAEFLLADVGENQRRRAHLENILRAASRGAGVTRQLLAVGGQQIIDRAELDLNVIVSGLETLLRRLAGSRVNIALTLEPALPHIEGDAAQIEQVLLHLAANARDAMPDGGTIMIETFSSLSDEARARSDAEPSAGGYVWLIVRDTGCGMDAGTKAHLFEPFFSAKAAGLDVGLGLPTVYGIIHQLGGSISVESQIGHGSSFTIALPRARAASEVVAARVHTSEADGPTLETIVLVDDEQDVRSVMRLALRQKGYNVIEATNAAQAIRIVEQRGGDIDLLLTDVIMPGMTGRELYDHLARRYPGMKVLYVSGYTDDAFGQAPIEGGSFLSKPFRLETLAQKVREVLDAQRQ